jgi:pimeloyl-ACP methyl ester carboxylesterase
MQKLSYTLYNKSGRKFPLDFRFKEKTQKPTIIFCHGFKGFKDWGHFPLLLEELAKQNYGVVSFNFSLNGGTVEQPIDFPDLDAFSKNTYSQELEDLGVVVDFIEHELLENHPFLTNDIYLMGHSRGGGIAILHAAKDNRVKKLITLAAVSDFIKRLPNEKELKEWERTGVKYILNGRTKQEMPMRYDFVRDLLTRSKELNIKSAEEKLNIPHLILHGKNDEAVDYQDAVDLHKSNPSSQLQLINETNHTFGGFHPYNKSTLPSQTQICLNEILLFLSQN